MNILIESNLDKSFLAELSQRGHLVFTKTNDFHQKYEFVLGSTVFFQAEPKIKGQYHLLLTQEGEDIGLDLYNSIQPAAILNRDNFPEILQKIDFLSQNLKTKEKALLARSNIEAKRQDLERLNFFLSHQEKEKSSALRVFHVEESNKKQREKKLLFFLDFINTNYAKSSFLDELFLYFSQEIKKMGGYYQLGILVVKNDEKILTYYRYNQKEEYIQKKISGIEVQKWNAQSLSSFLANVYQRPVGKLLLWGTHNEAESIYFYIENPSKNCDLTALESFIVDRMSLLSIVISRWSAEQTEKSVLKQWRETFKAYKDPIHVVDDEFNIILSNYTQELDSNDKCYKVLADRDSQCPGCPIQNKPSESILKLEINGTQYRLFHSSFTLEKKYNLFFYEDLTEINSLRSQVVQSEKMNTIGNLANHLSHELNNPLTGLKLATDLLISEVSQYEKQPGYHNLKNDLEQISKGLVRSEMIVKDLVDFSHPVENKIKPTDLSEVVNKTLTLLKSILRNTRIFVDIKNTVVMVHSVYLQQVIFNLIKNACEAMKFSGAIKVYLVEKTDQIELVIEDNGPGVSLEDQKFLFNPFFTTKAEKEGTGLGLYLCRNLMRKMNADLVYDSHYKAGARFIIRFKI